MTTCERVRDVLPSLAVGECDEGDLLVHVETCPACRAEREALARDVERVRAGLEPLAPSPELGDAVLDAAREADTLAGRPREPRALSWAVALPALAAVVAAAFLLPRWLGSLAPTGDDVLPREAGSPPGTEDHRPTAVVSPATAVEIASTRAENVPSLGKSDESFAPGAMLAEALWPLRPKELGAMRTVVREFPAPEAGLGLHRWVYGDPGGRAGRRVWRMGASPVPGVLVGRAILKDLATNGESLNGHGLLAKGARRLHFDGSHEIDVVLASPDGSTRCTVRAVFDQDFEGGVWVPDPLARALALHQFEIPGGAAAEHTDPQDPKTVYEVVGERARVRLLIPPLEYETVLEAFVPTPDKWPAVWHDAPTHVLTFEGEEPTWATHDVGDGSPDVAEELAAVRARWAPVKSVLAGLSWTAGPASPVVLGFGREGSPESFAFVGRLPQGARTERTQRLILDGKFPAGARAVLARVWRDRIAIPSAEAVCVADVAADGTLSFVRVRGEEGRTLRMRLTTREGQVTWHEIGVDGSVDAGVFARLKIDAKGVVSLSHLEPATGREWSDEGLWDLAKGDAVRQSLEDLLPQFVGVKSNPGLDDGTGASRARLLLEAEPATPWAHVGWALALAQRDDVRMGIATLSLPGAVEPLVADLEAARALRGGKLGTWSRWQVILRRADGATAGTSVEAQVFLFDAPLEVPIPQPEPEVAGASSVRQTLPRLGADRAERDIAQRALAVALRDGGPGDARCLGDLRIAGDVPYDDVRLVLRALWGAGAQVFRFGSAR